MDNKNKFHDNLIVSSAPHIVSDTDTTRVMATVIVALLPALCVGIYVFGIRVLALAIACMLSSSFFEWGYNRLLKRPQTVGDLSAALTGLLIAMNVPSTLPIWMGVVGSFVAIVIVKQLYGGIGRNFVNPAITGRIVLFISFASEMSTWPVPKMADTDALTGPTPLGHLAAKEFEKLPSNLDMFLGFIGGSVGEVSAIALIIGGLFLVWKKIISPVIPCAFIGTVFVLTLIYYSANPASGHNAFSMALFHILAGGVMLGAIFMATDYVTTPKLTSGQIFFGIGCGLITVVIRLWASYPEGVSFSILLMNICTPLINRVTFKRYIKGGAK